MNKFARCLFSIILFWASLVFGFFLPMILGALFPTVFYVTQKTLLCCLTQVICLPLFSYIGYVSSRRLCGTDLKKCTVLNCAIAAVPCFFLLAIVGTVHLAYAAVISCLLLVCFAKTENGKISSKRMKIWAYASCLFSASVIVVTISNIGNDPQTPLASLLFFAACISVIALAVVAARKWSYGYAKKEFTYKAASAKLSLFDYAKSIAPTSIIAHCDEQQDKPYYVVTSYLDDQAKAKQISQPCADALIEGYTELMRNNNKQ